MLKRKKSSSGSPYRERVTPHAIHSRVVFLIVIIVKDDFLLLIGRLLK